MKRKARRKANRPRIRSIKDEASPIIHITGDAPGDYMVYGDDLETVQVRRAKVKASVWTRLGLHVDSLDPYHGSGALVMTAGSVGMIVASCLALGPLWAGFLAGALPTLLLAALVHPEHA